MTDKNKSGMSERRYKESLDEEKDVNTVNTINTMNTMNTTSSATLPQWAWILIGVFVLIVLGISIYLYVLKWKTLSKDPKELTKYLIAKEASNAAVNIFGPGPRNQSPQSQSMQSQSQIPFFRRFRRT